jgi:uncharacterized membrane protein
MKSVLNNYFKRISRNRKKKKSNLSSCKIGVCTLILLSSIDAIIGVFIYAMNLPKSKQIYNIFYIS